MPRSEDEVVQRAQQPEREAHDKFPGEDSERRCMRDTEHLAG